MNTRTVSGVLFSLDGQPLKNASVTIYFSPSSYTPEGLIQPGIKSYRTDESGHLTATLFANEEGEVETRYTLRAPDLDTWQFTVPAGTAPLSWSELRALGVTEHEPQYATLASFVTQEIEEQLGTGGVFPTDPDGILIVDAGLL